MFRRPAIIPDFWTIQTLSEALPELLECRPENIRGAQGRVRSESFELCRFDSIFVGAAFYGLKIAAKHDIIYSRKGGSI